MRCNYTISSWEGSAFVIYKHICIYIYICRGCAVGNGFVEITVRDTHREMLLFDATRRFRCYPSPVRESNPPSSSSSSSFSSRCHLSSRCLWCVAQAVKKEGNRKKTDNRVWWLVFVTFFRSSSAGFVDCVAAFSSPKSTLTRYVRGHVLERQDVARVHHELHLHAHRVLAAVAVDR